MPHQEVAQDSNIPEAELHLRRFGKYFITPVFSIGSGIISIAACYFLPFFASLTLPWLIISLSAVFIAEFIVHVAFFKNSVPDTLIDIFIHDIFKDLSPKKKILLSIGLIFALGGGLALAALTSNSVQFTLGKFCMFAFSTATPVWALIFIAGFLAAVALFAYTCLLAKYISLAIKHNIHEKIAIFFKKIFTRNKDIPLVKQVFEGFFQLLLVTFILVITIIGTISLLGTMQKHLLKFLMLIPQANELACKVASIGIIYGLTGPARLPFALESVCSVFSRLGKTIGYLIYRTGLFLFLIFPHLFETATNRIEAEKISYIDDVKNRLQIPDNFKTISTDILKLVIMIIHGLSFGALAKNGGTEALEDTLAIPHETAEILSVTTAPIMASTIAFYHLFPKEIPKASTPIGTQEEKIEIDKEITLL